MAQLLPILLKEITCFIGVLYIQMFSSLKIGKIKEKWLVIYNSLNNFPGGFQTK